MVRGLLVYVINVNISQKCCINNAVSMSCSILLSKLIKIRKVNKIMLILEINLWFSQIDEILVQMSSICSLNFEP